MRSKTKSIFTVILLVITVFTLSACSGFTFPTATTTATTSGEEKAVPVYQGMVVSETLNTLSENDSINSNIMRLSNIGITRNLNTNPIDQDDPFGTLDEGTISEVIATEFPVTQTEVSDYYSEINKDIYITVKLSNPDDFVILSFTLNGVFYQSYQFQDGSDSENLILKVNTGTVSGVKEYTIDAIKYIDGTDIKDAIFAGERTITVGLNYSSEPLVLVSNEVVNATSILLTVNFSDSQSLSTLNKIVLYDGASLVQIYDLSLGENNIVFDKLNINTLYQYAVISVYDLIDGNNSRLSILEKKASYTDDIVAIDNVVPTETSIGFGVTVTDADQVGSVSAIELYKGETLVETITDLSVREFTGLLSNNEYTIKVTYTYDLNDGVGSQTLTINQASTTIAKATPTVLINNIIPTQTSIGFGVTVTDVDQVGAVSTIELYKGETLVEALTDLSVREFTGLLSNNEYTIKVTYTYDLNDGIGPQTLTINQAATTVAKATPTVSIDNVVPTQDSIGFGITVTDVNQVGSVSAIELYKGETLVEALTDLSVREFTGLLSNNEYTVKVTYTYDLNDGFDSKEIKISYVSYTKAAYIDITDVEIINTEVIKVEDAVEIRLSLSNPDEVHIEAFYINGQRVPVIGINIVNLALLQVVPETNGGDFNFEISGIEYSHHSFITVQSLISPINIEVFILGQLTVEKLYSDTNYIIEDIQNYFYIGFENLTSYELSSISLYSGVGSVEYLSNEIEYIDDNTIRILCKNLPVDYINLYGVNINYIEYKHIDDSEYSYVNFENFINLIPLHTAEIKNLSSVDDLINIELGYNYQLINDIDLSSNFWNPISYFTGSVNGNGYSIKNLNSTLGGLFEFFNGEVKNLRLEDFYISLNDNTWGINAGCLARAGNIFIDNLYLTGTIIAQNGSNPWYDSIGGVADYGIHSISNSYIDVDIIANSFSGRITIGGISSQNIPLISNSEYLGTITVNSPNSFVRVGGFVGGVASSKIENSIMSGSIVIENASEIYIGGFIGFSENQYPSIIEYPNVISNAIMMGSITTNSNKGQIGGFIGNLGSINDMTYIGNSLFIGNISSISNLPSDVGVFSSTNINLRVENSFSAYDVSVKNNNSTINVNNTINLEQLNSYDFYIEDLLWDSIIWDLSNLDYLNKKYPKIYQIVE